MYITPGAMFDKLTAYYTLHRQKIEPNTGSTNGSASIAKITVLILSTFQGDNLNVDSYLEGG